MKPLYTAVVQRDGKWWIGWIEEIRVSMPRPAPVKNCWTICAPL